MKTVLLAFERAPDLATLETLLQSRGYGVLKAHSGLEALEVVRRDSPHVVVSDVLLPRLDGFSLCRRLKEDPVLRMLPVLLLSFRVEGPKYEAFAAEVGAQRFFPRGAALDDLVVAIGELAADRGTMRIPALDHAAIDRHQRELDDRRVADLERKLKDAHVTNKRLAARTRAILEKAEAEARGRAEEAAADAVATRTLQEKLHELEARERQMLQTVTQAQDAAEESRAGFARVGVLETRLAELQASRARAQAAAIDAERVFVSQPVPAWLTDMATHEVRVANDAAAALFGSAREQLIGRSILEWLPGSEPGPDSARLMEVTLERPDGSPTVLELRHQSVSYEGRACWITTARDVTHERARSAGQERVAVRALGLEKSPVAACLTEAGGRLQYANGAFLALVGVDAGAIAAASLEQFEAVDRETTRRRVGDEGDGQWHRECRWRRADGTTLDVEVTSTPVGDAAGTRVVSVRDLTQHRRALRRAERDRQRVAVLLELTQRAHSLTETEMLAEALELASELTGSAVAHYFAASAEPAQLELAAAISRSTEGADRTLLARWRGTPPAGTALADCLGSQQPVTREKLEGTGALRQAGLPASLGRQLCVPIADGARLEGILLLADKLDPYCEDDREQAFDVADRLGRLLRRRRADAEIMSSMDHMERVMLGVVESLADLAEPPESRRSGRAQRVGELAAGIGAALGLPGLMVRGLRVAGQLIDVGMLQIPREIIWRPGELTTAEHELVKTHCERGYESLKRIEFPWPVAEVVRQHHERLDGSGYPRGLKGEEILLEARIVAVADAAEAMLSPRPHRAALPLAACIEELQSQAGRRYDARVVKTCVKLLRERPSRTEGESTVDQRIA